MKSSERKGVYRKGHVASAEARKSIDALKALYDKVRELEAQSIPREARMETT